MSLGVPASAATPVGRFRIVAFWEGISFLLLLFVAMPLKYGFGVDMGPSGLWAWLTAFSSWDTA